MNDSTKSYFELLAFIISKYLFNAKIILYGSRARGDSREGSDIDVAIDNGTPIEEPIMSAIIGEIEESNLPICFDVVDFYEVSRSIQQEILKDGIVWKK